MIIATLQGLQAARSQAIKIETSTKSYDAPSTSKIPSNFQVVTDEILLLAERVSEIDHVA